MQINGNIKVNPLPHRLIFQRLSILLMIGELRAKTFWLDDFELSNLKTCNPQQP